VPDDFESEDDEADEDDDEEGAEVAVDGFDDDGELLEEEPRLSFR